MPSFRALPPSMTTAPDAGRHAIRTRRSIHVPVARAMVDCGVYADGTRLPGKYTHAAALDKVRELEAQGTPAFVWIGLHEPDDHQMQAVADVFGLHELAVEDAVHAHQRPEAGALRRHPVPGAQDRQVRRARVDGQGPRDRRDRRDHDLRRARLRGHRPARRPRRPGRGAQADGRHRRHICALGPYAVMHAIADHVVDSYLGCHRAHRDRHRRHGGERLLPAPADRDRAHLPAQARGRRDCAERSARWPPICSGSAPTTTT